MEARRYRSLRACELYLLVDATQIIMREKIEFYLFYAAV